MKKSSLFRIFVILIISSALTALIVFFVMPEFGKKYKADLIELYSESNSISTFYDLDYDGVSENISFKHDTNKPFVIVKDGISLTIIEQWNFHTGTFGDFGFANFDHDTLQEVYFTYFINDSINLYQIVPIRNSHKKSIFISFTSQHQGEYEYPGTFAGTYDLNDDGFNEIIFTFEAGFTLKPRKIIAWDVKNDTIYSSPFSGTAIFYPDIEDINNDNNLEILGQTRAFDNCENFPYSDSTAWLMVLDDQLNFLFEPVPIGENYSIVTYKPINSQENRNIIALHTSNTKEMSSEILLFSAMGKLISKKPLPADYSYADSWLYINRENNLAYVILTDNVILVVDSLLNIVKEIKIPKFANGKPFLLDIDLDGNHELVFNSALIEELIIYRKDFANPVKLNLPSLGHIIDVSLKLSSKEGPLLSIHYNDRQALVKYSLNKMFYLKFIIYFAVFGLLFYFVWLGFYLKRLKFVSSAKIMELEVKSISNQMESHFTLNTLNAIGSLYAQDDKEKADYYFGKYARMVRNTLIQSDKISQTLEQELDYVRNYLDIQKFRMNERFDYRIEIGKSVDNGLRVPKMILFTFVENAVKHGIKNKQGKGYLEIKIENIDNVYHCVIEDNGIGRKKAGELSESSTGKGIKILGEILELHYQESGKRVRYKIEDLIDESGNASGTKVIVTF